MVKYFLGLRAGFWYGFGCLVAGSLWNRFVTQTRARQDIYEPLNEIIAKRAPLGRLKVASGGGAGSGAASCQDGVWDGFLEGGRLWRLWAGGSTASGQERVASWAGRRHGRWPGPLATALGQGGYGMPSDQVTLDAIKEQVSQGRGVLVACRQGAHRAPMVAALFIIGETKAHACRMPRYVR